MKPERPERDPDWLVNNDWSAESRLKAVKELINITPNRWTDDLGSKSHKSPKRVAVYCLLNHDDKKDCEFWWNEYVLFYERSYGKGKGGHKTKDKLEKLMNLLNQNVSISDIAKQFNVTEITIKRWIKEVKLDM